MELQIGVRYGKRLQPDVIRLLQPAVLAGQVLGHVIRKRVSATGKAADGSDFGRYTSSTAWVDPRAPQPPGEYQTASDGRKLYASDTYHAALHGDDRYRVRVTGGMWESLSVSAANSGRVRVMFRRSSLSASGSRVANRTKAKNAQALARAPFLEPSDDEVRDALGALAEQLDRSLLAESAAAAAAQATKPVTVRLRGGGSVRASVTSLEIPT